MPDERLTLVVTMTVRKDAADAFRAFESAAAEIMAMHGGTIERTVVTEGDDATFKEIHIVTFPSAEAFARYRNDPALAQVRHLRQESVIATELLIGKDGPDYGP
jgi:uncharacterized protein (DUF1330 family)